MKTGDFVKILPQEFAHRADAASKTVIGTIISISPMMPHLEPYSPLQPGPIYNVQILTTEGKMWTSCIDQRDSIEVIKEL